MTLRDVQDVQKSKKLPWTPAKAFDTSLGLGPFIPASNISDPNNIEIWLTVNGEIKQAASTNLMIFNVQRLISEASHITTLYPGDIVMTGTPEGVGQVDNGAILKAGIKGLESSECEFTVISI